MDPSAYRNVCPGPVPSQPGHIRCRQKVAPGTTAADISSFIRMTTWLSPRFAPELTFGQACMKIAFNLLTIIARRQPLQTHASTGVVQENDRGFHNEIQFEMTADLPSCPTSRLALSSCSVCTHAHKHERRDKTLKKNGVNARRCS